MHHAFHADVTGISAARQIDRQKLSPHMPAPGGASLGSRELSLQSALPNPPLMKLIPIAPLPAPSISSARRTTTMPAPLTLTPVVPLLARIPPGMPAQSMVMDFVMVTVPNPPGSRQLITPEAAVFIMAPAKVLHGAVRLHGSVSLPAPETQVRVA